MYWTFSGKRNPIGDPTGNHGPKEKSNENLLKAKENQIKCNENVMKML